MSEEKKAVQTAAPNTHFEEMNPAQMTVLLDLLKRNKKQLMARKGVYKVDVGYRWKDGQMTGEIALRVHVKDKKPADEVANEDLVPDEIEGFPVDVIQSNIEKHLDTSRHDPIIGGSETRNINVGGVGTLGAVVFDRTNNNQRLALSNFHVFVAGRANGALNEQVNQPGSTVAGDEIGRIVRSSNALDCAVAVLNNSRQISTSIRSVPGGIKGMIDPTIGMRVMKSGRTTDTTFAMVEGVSDTEFTIVPVPNEWQEISSGGDSGSIWLERNSHAAIGLHYGGETSNLPADERAWAKIITRVANQLNIDVRRKAVLGDTSPFGSALASKTGQILLSWVGTSNLRLNFMRSTNGLAFTGKVTLADTSPVAPALTVFNGRYILAWIGVGNNRINIMQSTDGAVWSSKVVLNDTSLSSPSLTVFAGKIFLSWRGVGNNQLNVMQSTDGVNWSNKVVLNDTTVAGPSLAALGNTLYIAWKGNGNNNLNVMRSTDGSAFTNKVTLGDTTTVSPFLVSHANTLFLAWQGVGNLSLNVMQSVNGVNWSNKIVLRETCTDRPALASANNDFVWSWAGTNAAKNLNTLLYDLRM